MTNSTSITHRMTFPSRVSLLIGHTALAVNEYSRIKKSLFWHYLHAVSPHGIAS